MDAKLNFESKANMAVKKKFVSFETHGSATEMVEYILADEGNSYVPLSWSSELPRPKHYCCPSCGAELDTNILVSTLDPSIKIEIDSEAPADEKYLCPLCGCGYETEKEARECCAQLLVHQCSECFCAVPPSELEDLAEADEPYEWVIVTSWLGLKLADLGELVLESDDGLCFWGRTGKNVPLEEDEAINSICYELKILTGQENYREVK